MIGGRHGDPQPRLRGQLRLQRLRPAEAGRRALRRRAQPPEPGAHAQAGRQPAAARRAHERPGRRDAGQPGGGAAGVPRLRRGDLATTAGSSTAWPRTSWRGRAPTRTPATGTWFEGNFEAYQENRMERLGPEASKPAPPAPQAHARLGESEQGAVRTCPISPQRERRPFGRRFSMPSPPAPRRPCTRGPSTRGRGRRW